MFTMIIHMLNSQQLETVIHSTTQYFKLQTGLSSTRYVVVILTEKMLYSITIC